MLRYSIIKKYGIDPSFVNEFSALLKVITIENDFSIDKFSIENYDMIKTDEKYLLIESKLEELIYVMCDINVINKYITPKIIIKRLSATDDSKILDDETNASHSSKMYGKLTYNYKNYYAENYGTPPEIFCEIFPLELSRLITRYLDEPTISHNYNFSIKSLPRTSDQYVHKNTIINEEEIVFNLKELTVKLRHAADHIYSHPHDETHKFYKKSGGSITLKNSIILPKVITVNNIDFSINITNEIQEKSHREESVVNELLTKLKNVDDEKNHCQKISRIFIFKNILSEVFDEKILSLFGDVHRDQLRKNLDEILKEIIKNDTYIIIDTQSSFDITIVLMSADRIKSLIGDLEFVADNYATTEKILDRCHYHYAECPFDNEMCDYWYNVMCDYLVLG